MKLKNWFNRGMALLLVVVLTVGISACKGSSAGKSSGSASGGVDFGGKTLKISIWSDSTIPSLGKSEAGDAAYYALEQAKKEFNCDIEWVILPESQYFDEFVKSSLSGSVYSNIALLHSNSILSWIKQGLVEPTDKFIGEDAEGHWNNTYANFKGVNYGLMPKAQNPTPYMLLYYNTRMIKELGLEDPQKLALENKWTWEVFRDYCAKATDKSKGTYGVSAFMLPDCLRYTNGAYLWTQGSDGKYYNAYSYKETNKNALELLELIQNMAIKDNSILGDRTGGVTAMDLALNTFTDGNLLFMYGQKGATLKAQGFTDYAPVTFPIGPSSTANYNMRDGFSIWGIPTTNDFPAEDLAKFWMYAQTTWDKNRGDAYYEPDTDEMIDALFASTYQRREDAEFVYEMGEKMPEKASLNSLLNLGSIEVNEIFYPVIVGQSTPAAVIEATNSVIQSRIDEVFNSK